MTKLTSWSQCQAVRFRNKHKTNDVITTSRSYHLTSRSLHSLSTCGDVCFLWITCEQKRKRNHHTSFIADHNTRASALLVSLYPATYVSTYNSPRSSAATILYTNDCHLIVDSWFPNGACAVYDAISRRGTIVAGKIQMDEHRSHKYITHRPHCHRTILRRWVSWEWPPNTTLHKWISKNGGGGEMSSRG